MFVQHADRKDSLCSWLDLFLESEITFLIWESRNIVLVLKIHICVFISILNAHYQESMANNW